MANTPILNIPYPDEGQEEFYDSFVSMMREIERITLMNKLQTSLFLGGGGTVTFTSGTSVLQWTDDFVIPVPHYGQKITVENGPISGVRQATLPDGAMLILEIPYTMNNDITTDFLQVTQLDRLNHQQCVFAVRIGDKVHLRGAGVIG